MKPPSLFADDIITPVYVAPTRSPTTFRPKHHKENIQERPSCDDEEDCEEGSGEPVTTEEIFVTSTTGPFLSHFSFNSLVIDSLFFLLSSFSLFFFFFYLSFFLAHSCFQNTWFKPPERNTLQYWSSAHGFLSFTFCSMYYHVHTPDEVFPRLVCAVFDRFLLTEYASEICSMASLKWRFWGGMVLAFRSSRACGNIIERVSACLVVERNS